VYIPNKENNLHENLIYKNYIKKIGLIFLLVSFPGLVYKFYYLIYSVLQNGYLSLYTGINQNLLSRLIELISFKFYIVGISFYLYGLKTKREFYFISIIMLIISVVYLSIGQRGMFGITVLFLIWYRHTYIAEIKINFSMIFKVGLTGIFLIYFFGYIQSYRAGESFKDNHPIRNTLASQGVSGIVVPYYIDYKKEMDSQNSLYIFDPIINRHKGRSNNIEALKNRDYFSYELTALLDFNAYLNGEGVGSSYIAEIYEWDIFGVCFGMILLGLFIGWYENNKYKSIPKVLSWIVVSSLVWLPRGEIFMNFYEFLFILLTFFIFYMIKIITKKNKKV
jgi:oligosaccharide repeat unit polymerase